MTRDENDRFWVIVDIIQRRSGGPAHMAGDIVRKLNEMGWQGPIRS